MLQTVSLPSRTLPSIPRPLLPPVQSLASRSDFGAEGGVKTAAVNATALPVLSGMMDVYATVNTNSSMK